MRILLLVIFGISSMAFSGLRISKDGIRLSRNFHEIDPGKFYRSAQLTEEEFAEVIPKYGIKTVINLQGENPGFDWYDGEIRAMKKYGVKHYDISMATENIPRRDSLIKLLEVYKTAERPILVHCRSGADRAGEASAIYAMDYMGKTKEEALHLLNWRYFHIESFVPSKRYFVGMYGGKEWALKQYNPCDKNYHHADRRFCQHQSLQ